MRPTIGIKCTEVVKVSRGSKLGWVTLSWGKEIAQSHITVESRGEEKEGEEKEGEEREG